MYICTVKYTNVLAKQILMTNKTYSAFTCLKKD